MRFFASVMTATDARQKFDFRWTVLGAAVTGAASLALLQLSWASAGFVAFAVVGVFIGGLAARRLLVHDDATRQFMLVQRARMLAIAGIVLAAAALVRSNERSLMVIAAIALWIVAISSFLQIGARYL